MHVRNGFAPLHLHCSAPKAMRVSRLAQNDFVSGAMMKFFSWTFPLFMWQEGYGRTRSYFNSGLYARALSSDILYVFSSIH